MTPCEEHAYVPVSERQSICARCHDVLTIGDGLCFRCQKPLDNHFSAEPGPAPGACVTISSSRRA